MQFGRICCRLGSQRKSVRHPIASGSASGINRHKQPPGLYPLAEIYGTLYKSTCIFNSFYLYNMEETIEIKRLENLYKYEILNTPEDGYFDEITSLAAKIFNVPVAIITLVDTDRIWFKSSHGLDIDEIPRDPGLCSSAIMSDDIYIVENARVDARTLANPLVAGVMGLQFYAAAPLKSRDGYNLGTFCIIDKIPRKLDAKEASMLMQLSRIAMDQFELKLQSRLMIKEIQNKISE